MLKNSSRETFTETINTTGETGKSERCLFLFLYFLLVSIIFFLFFFFLLVFLEANLKQSRVLGCVYTKRRKTPTKAFRFLSLQVNGYDVVQCAVMWWVVTMSPCAWGGSGFSNRVGPGPGLLRVLVPASLPSGTPQGLCACMCWRPVKGQQSQAGSISDGWNGWDSREKEKKIHNY